MSKAKFYVTNNHERVYMIIMAKNHKEAEKIFSEESGIFAGTVYTENNWIRWCGKSQAQFYNLKKI